MFSDLSPRNYIEDAEDKTCIANVEEKDNGKKGLHVIADIDSIGTSVSITVDSNLRYKDMNVSTGGVARDTNIGGTWTTIFEEDNAEGLLFGFVVTLESIPNNWFIRLVVDGEEVFGPDGIDLEDLEDTDIHGFENSTDDVPFLGFQFYNKTFRWRTPPKFGMTYNSSVEILARRTGGSKKFKGGLVAISVE